MWDKDGNKVVLDDSGIVIHGKILKLKIYQVDIL
jgi:hypothetical protein